MSISESAAYMETERQCLSIG